MERLLILSLLFVPFVHVGAALAQPEESVEIDVEVVGADDGDRQALETAATAGIESATAGEGEGGTLTVEVEDDGTLVIRYRSAAGETRRRRADAPDAAPERTTMVTLLVRSLLDDEASRLLDSLDAPPPAEETPIIEPTPTPPTEIVIVPHYVDAEVEAAAVQREPEPFVHMPVALDFAPYVGVSSATRGGDVRNFSLGALGDLYGAVEGVAIGGLVSIGRAHAHGLQIGGIFAMAPDEVTGLQIGGLFALSGPLTGGQIGFVNAATGDVLGTQIGFVNVGAAEVTGAQVGFVNVGAAETSGAQIGFVNVSGGDSAGAQIGFVNTVAGTHEGVQIGFVNVADDADLGIGLINIYPEGRTQVSANVDTSGFIQAELSHGGRYVHNVVLAGANPFHSDAAPVIGAGLGGLIPLAERADLSIDALFRCTFRNLDQGTYDLLPGARATLALSLAPGVAVTVGASYTVQVTNDPSVPDYGNLLGWTHQPYEGDNTVRSHVAFSGGIRFF